MEQTWRWYGPDDPVTLADIRQAGATGVVTALHDIPIGAVWPKDALDKRKHLIEWDMSAMPPRRRGLTWSVIESIPVHEDIKQGKRTRDRYIDNYCESVYNAGMAGIPVVCYNFMPVVDWTRTDLEMELEDGARALAFSLPEFAAFDLHILRRPGAADDYDQEILDLADAVYESMSDQRRYVLQHNIIAGLPGGQEGYTLEQFQERLNEYRGIGEDQYRQNLLYFLERVIPVAEGSGVKMAIHPDDPPMPLFGLPRIVRNEMDLSYILNTVDSPNNGWTMCTGSYGVLPENDLVGMIERYGNRLNFAHLRSTQRDGKGSFHEASHLRGDVDMYGVIVTILREQRRRYSAHRTDYKIPMRADHGHTILDDLRKKTNPGYSAIGLLRGMAELRGLEMGVEKSGAVMG